MARKPYRKLYIAPHHSPMRLTSPNLIVPPGYVTPAFQNDREFDDDLYETLKKRYNRVIALLDELDEMIFLAFFLKTQ